MRALAQTRHLNQTWTWTWIRTSLLPKEAGMVKFFLLEAMNPKADISTRFKECICRR